VNLKKIGVSGARRTKHDNSLAGAANTLGFSLTNHSFSYSANIA
jgi:hypothetical protein